MNEIELIPLISYILATTFTPGPNNLTTASLAMNHGLKKTMPYIYGIFIGVYPLMLIAGLFANFLAANFPHAQPILQWTGAAYISYLAYNIIKSSTHINHNQTTPLWGPKKAIILQLVNPKVLIYGLTIFPVFLWPMIDNKSLLSKII